MYLTHTIFDGNYAQFGAALCREANAQKGSGENNTFKNNHAFVSGAALGWMGSIGITITDYKFINNSADVSGGAIYVSPGSHNCSIIDSYFEDNFVTNRTQGVDSFSWDSWDHNTIFYRLQRTGLSSWWCSQHSCRKCNNSKFQLHKKHRKIRWRNICRC